MSIRTDLPTGNSAIVPPHERILISEDTSCALLDISKPVFRRWVAAGVIHPVKLPFECRRKLYRRADIAAFAESLEVDSTVA